MALSVSLPPRVAPSLRRNWFYRVVGVTAAPLSAVSFCPYIIRHMPSGAQPGVPTELPRMPAKPAELYVRTLGVMQMKVFISWSGAVSHRVAVVLRDWLTFGHSEH